MDIIKILADKINEKIHNMEMGLVVGFLVAREYLPKGATMEQESTQLFILKSVRTVYIENGTKMVLVEDGKAKFGYKHLVSYRLVNKVKHSEGLSTGEIVAEHIDIDASVVDAVIESVSGTFKAQKMYLHSN